MISILGAYFRTPRIQIAALLYFIVAGALTQVPLFNYLGYEFSAVMTVPAAVISGLLTLSFLKEHRMKPLTKRTWLYVVIDYLHVNFLLLLIPLAVMTANAAVVKNCAFTKGIAFYLLLPVVTMVFSVSLALVVGTIFRRSKLVFVLLIALILLHIPVVTVVLPQLYAYNPVLGFFPGITYDETVGDLSTLTLYRQFTVIAALFCNILFFEFIGRWNPSLSTVKNIKQYKRHHHSNTVMTIAGIAALAVLCTGWVYRSELGFEHSAGDIQRQLGRRTESEHFIMFYSDQDYTIREIQRIKAESEFHYSVVTERLKTAENNRRKILVYLYPTAEIKQQLIGTSNTNIAKPWKREIHLTSSSFRDSFRHEVVHILAGEFGVPGIRASTRMGLNEGLATAIDWETGYFTPHHYAAAMLRDKELKDIPSLFSVTGFAVRSSASAYVVSGSFTKYLIDRFGIERFKPAFRNGAFVRTFNESLTGLTRDWMAFLRTIDTSDLPPETVQAMFVHPPIFYKECAREVAGKNRQGAAAIRVKNFPEAQRQFSDSYNDAPSAFALRGLLHSLIAQQKYPDAIEQYDRLPGGSLIRINPSLLILYADAVYLAGESDRAADLLLSVLHMNINDSFAEAATLRRQYITERVERDLYFGLMYSGEDDSAKIQLVDRFSNKRESRDLSLFYTKGILYQRTERDDEALRHFQKVCEDAAQQELAYSALIRSAGIEHERGRYEAAKVLYWNAKNYAPTPSVIEYLDEQIELCDAVLLSE
ncbi:MAG: tetratricopeptide repeat protein [Bacteroidota bacterium]